MTPMVQNQLSITWALPNEPDLPKVRNQFSTLFMLCNLWTGWVCSPCIAHEFTMKANGLSTSIYLLYSAVQLGAVILKLQ